jgi:hypothetical protein
MTDRVFKWSVLVCTHLGAVAIGLALAQHNLWLVR